MQTGKFTPIEVGSIAVWPPVVLAPMAGVTNYPFRKICRSFGAGLYVSEMITARPLVMGISKTERLAEFGPDEPTRSLQLYGVDPHFVGKAVRLLVEQERVDHIDMNFGCPVRKVTRKGGGAALPYKRQLFRQIVRAAVQNAGDIPVTIKFRIGIDDEHETYLEAGLIGQEEGVKAVALHARTAAQLYSGNADWSAIKNLKQAVNHIPVLGNGDIWEAQDAIRMMRETGCDGVVVGRGCLGRPWLFRDLDDAFNGRPAQPPPDLGEIASIMLDHAEALCTWFGAEPGIRMFRKHATWYTKGFRQSASLRQALMRIRSVVELNTVLASVDQTERFPAHAARLPRAKRSGTQKVSLPEGFLASRDEVPHMVHEENEPVSGG